MNGKRNVCQRKGRTCNTSLKVFICRKTSVWIRTKDNIMFGYCTPVYYIREKFSYNQ